MKRKLFTIFLSALLLCMAALPCMQLERGQAATKSKAECVVEVSSRRILFERNSDVNLPMASTTKVLTAIIILEDCDLDEEVTVPKQAAGTEGSSVYLKAGEVLTVRDLLYGLMLRSGNDCAVTLALHHSGSIERFAQVMNERAVSYGAEDSYFVNPHGLPDKRHRTTARDLALVSAHAMENEMFREIVACKLYAPKNWYNKNKMLYQYDGAIGVKTGFTLSAGRCLVTAAERNGMKLVSVVLDSPQMYERSAEILDYGFANYAMFDLCLKDEPIEGFRILSSFSYPLTKAEREKIKIEVETDDSKEKEIGAIAGIMKIYLENRLLFSQNLYMMKQ